MIKKQDIVFSLILDGHPVRLRGILPYKNILFLYGKIKPLKHYILLVLEKIYELIGIENKKPSKKLLGF